MSDLLTRLAERALGRAAPAVQPRLAPRFADPFPAPSLLAEEAEEVDAVRPRPALAARAAAPHHPPGPAAHPPAAPSRAEHRPAAEPARTSDPADAAAPASPPLSPPSPHASEPPLLATPVRDDAGDADAGHETLFSREVVVEHASPPAASRMSAPRAGDAGDADRPPRRGEVGPGDRDRAARADTDASFISRADLPARPRDAEDDGDGLLMPRAASHAPRSGLRDDPPPPAPPFPAEAARQPASAPAGLAREAPAVADAAARVSANPDRESAAGPVAREEQASAGSNATRESGTQAVAVTRVRRADRDAAEGDAAMPAHGAEAAPERPVIRVTIGRIEVRAAPPPQQPAPRQGWQPPVMSLDAFLKREAGR